MAITILAAFLLAFLVSAGFGKYYVAWLKKKEYTQPLKKEVAHIYKEQNDGEKEQKG